MEKREKSMGFKLSTLLVPQECSRTPKVMVTWERRLDPRPEAPNIGVVILQRTLDHMELLWP